MDPLEGTLVLVPSHQPPSKCQICFSPRRHNAPTIRVHHHSIRLTNENQFCSSLVFARVPRTPVLLARIQFLSRQKDRCVERFLSLTCIRLGSLEVFAPSYQVLHYNFLHPPSPCHCGSLPQRQPPPHPFMSTSPPHSSPTNAPLLFSCLPPTLCRLTLCLCPPLSLFISGFVSLSCCSHCVSPECLKLSQFVTVDAECQK